MARKTIGVRPEHLTRLDRQRRRGRARSASPSISAPTRSCMSMPTASAPLTARAGGEFVARTAIRSASPEEGRKIHRFDRREGLAL